MKKTIRTWLLISLVLLASGFAIRATLMTNLTRSVAISPQAAPAPPANYRVAPPAGTPDSLEDPSPERSPSLPN